MISDFSEKSELSLHKRLKFVTEVLKINLENADQLSLYYIPKMEQFLKFSHNLWKRRQVK